MRRKIFVAGLTIVLLCLTACGESRSEENTATTTLAKDSVSATGTQQSTQESASGQSSASDKDIIVVTEKMYVTYINDIYTNTDNYWGKTIKIQGMFKTESYEYDGETRSVTYVYRVGPGCCGNDGSMCGFEFTYDGDLPQENDWIEVVGVLDSYKEGEDSYLTLRATSVTTMDERGQETVNQ